MPVALSKGRALPKGYMDRDYPIEDTSLSSPDYFSISSCPDEVGGGRHIVRFKGSGLNLKLGSTIDVEMRDSAGQPMVCQAVNYIDRFNNYYIYFDVYDDTAPGIGAICLVGQAYDAPTQEFTVRWQRSINILPYERNNADLVFSEPPQVSVAQIVTPARLQVQSTGSSQTFSYLSSSAFTIVDTGVQGYDQDLALGGDILDTRLRDIVVDPNSRPKTANEVATLRRVFDRDVVGGVRQTSTTRFSTILQSEVSILTKDHLGGLFRFYSSESVPTSIQPNTPSYLRLVADAPTQMYEYEATIVEIESDRRARLSRPVTLSCYDTRYPNQQLPTSYTVKQLTSFTGSIGYLASDLNFVTSSTVSQSYVEFTFSDLKPISGLVHRIKTSAKLGAVVGDYIVINDQIVKPVEYLTDAAFPNGLSYAKRESDYRMIGHFTTQSVLDQYWINAADNPSGLYTISGSLSSNYLADAVILTPSASTNHLLTTAYNQNYTQDQDYTLSFNAYLGPRTVVEVFMSSEALSPFVVAPLASPRAFYRTGNREKLRYSGDYSRFGKFLGYISNESYSSRYYGKVLFDFQTDASGFGRPLLRCRTQDTSDGVVSSYISEVSVKPRMLNGFTPSIVQYSVPLPAEMTSVATLTQSIDFKIDYFDYTGRQSEFSTYLNDVVLNLESVIPSNTCQADRIEFKYITIP